MSQPFQVFSNGGQSYSVIDNGAAGAICTMTSTATTGCSSWTGITDGLNFDDAVNGSVESNGTANAYSNGSLPDYYITAKTLTTTSVVGLVIRYKNPS